MKKLIVSLAAFAFLAAFGGSAYAESAWAKIQMPMSNVGTSRCPGNPPPPEHFVFQGGTDPINSYNSHVGGASCANPIIMGALLGEADGILAGNGPCGLGFTVVLGFDKPLLSCDGDDMKIYAFGPGFCVEHPGVIKPAKVYVSSQAPCSCNEPIDMGYDYGEITPLPWYYDDSNWTYLGTIIPSAPPCQGGVPVETSFDFETDLNTGDNVTWHSGGPFGYFTDDDPFVDFDAALGGKVCWVKIVFGDLTSYDDYPSIIFNAYDAANGGLDPLPVNVVWGNGKAKFVDAVEGLYPGGSIPGDINADGKVDNEDKTRLTDNLLRNICFE